MPNPSIERTNNGGSSFTAFANAQPPLFASHLKRWAILEPLVPLAALTFYFKQYRGSYEIQH